MINWELPHDKVACPHCGATETQVTLQLLGLVRYSCSSCKKSFAVDGSGDTVKHAPADEKSPGSADNAPRQS